MNPSQKIVECFYICTIGITNPYFIFPGFASCRRQGIQTTLEQIPYTYIHYIKHYEGLFIFPKFEYFLYKTNLFLIFFITI